jgi:hypothetical protein
LFYSSQIPECGDGARRVSFCSSIRGCQYTGNLFLPSQQYNSFITFSASSCISPRPQSRPSCAISSHFSISTILILYLSIIS